MKDIANPLVLLAVVVLAACRLSTGSPESDSLFLLWELVLCATALIIDISLAAAYSLTRRPALMKVVWAMTFLILGCCLFVTAGAGDEPEDEEAAAFRALHEAWLAGQGCNVRDESGDCLLTLAAALGKTEVAKALLGGKEPIDDADKREAAHRAAESGRAEVLALFLDAGVSPRDQLHGTPLLCVAAQNGSLHAAELLLERGAEANQPDFEQTTPLIHAVIAESEPLVRLLLQHGADAALKDGQGRDAASYARSGAIRDLLSKRLQP